MPSQWFQVWVSVPNLGNQWSGWFYGTMITAQLLQAATSDRGHVVKQQDGSPLPVATPTGLPLPNLPWGWSN